MKPRVTGLKEIRKAFEATIISKATEIKTKRLDLILSQEEDSLLIESQCSRQ